MSRSVPSARLRGWFVGTSMLGLVLAVVSCAPLPPKPDERGTRLVIAAAYMAPIDVQRCRIAANRGDIEAAERLWFYFDVWRRKPNRASYWMRRAAELGSTGAQFSLGVELLAHPERGQLGEGERWLRKAAAAGDEDAQWQLDELGKSLNR
jgi:hypothetical protein